MTPTKENGDGTLSESKEKQETSELEKTPLSCCDDKRSGSVDALAARHPLIMNRITRDSMRYLDLEEANRKQAAKMTRRTSSLVTRCKRSSRRKKSKRRRPRPRARQPRSR